MTAQGWRVRAGTVFETEKRPVSASRGMVVTNHPLASAAGAEMLAACAVRGTGQAHDELDGAHDRSA